MSAKPDFNDVKVVDYLIKELWPTISAFAYQQFLSKGRGAVTVNLNKMVDTVINESQVECAGEIDYITRQELNSEEKMEQYDPEKEVVIVIDHRPHDNEPDTMYRFVAISSLDPYPKQAFESHPNATELSSPLQYKVQVNFPSTPINLNDAEAQKRFVRDSWATLAPMAYGYYLKHGRGALVINLSKAESRVEFANTKLSINTEYVALNDEKLKRFKESIQKLIRVYNPDEKVIYLFCPDEPEGTDPIEAHLHVGPFGNDHSPKRMYEIQRSMQ